MSKKAILFDLDGTLTDSGEGIINCAILALEHFGLPIPTREELGVFIGPPLDDSFKKFGVPEEKVDEALPDAIIFFSFEIAMVFPHFPIDKTILPHLLKYYKKKKRESQLTLS